ncbi:MAG: RhuM family protein, partial [Oscillospiraceae bacterium]
KDETIWLTQKAMAELFDCTADNISLHLKGIFTDGELEENSTTEEISVVQKEGNRNVTRTLKFYNLDAIISVGYRVNSKRATNFRIWAT